MSIETPTRAIRRSSDARAQAPAGGAGGSTRPRPHRPLPACAVALGVALLPGIVGAASAANRPMARSAHTVNVKDEGKLHLVHAVGNTLVEQGNATGTLPGTLSARLNIDATSGTAAATFSISLNGGTISGGSSGKSSGGHNGWESFKGRMWINHGTGRYAHASGSGMMYGALNRRNDQVTVQEFGRMRY